MNRGGRSPAPGLLPYELTKILGDFRVGDGFIALRGGENWVRLQGAFDADRIHAVIQGSSSGWVFRESCIEADGIELCTRGLAEAGGRSHFTERD